MADETALPNTVVQKVLTNLNWQMRRDLSARQRFTIPGIHVRLKLITKPATKPHKGRNPATGEEIQIAGKPKRHVVEAKVGKKFRDEIGAVTS